MIHQVRTAFNVLGPMLNPALAPYALVGVYTPSLMKLMGEALQKLGMQKGAQSRTPQGRSRD